MTDKDLHVTTTFKLSATLHSQLKIMCHLTHKSMGAFIRHSIVEQINRLRVGEPPNGK